MSRTFRIKRDDGWADVTAEEYAAHRKAAGAARGLGDLVSAVATPIARTLGLGCVDPATKQLRPESGCAQRRAALNRLFPMNTPDPRQRLLDRKVALEARVQQSTDAIILSKARLATLEQRHLSLVGELKAYTDLIAESGPAAANAAPDASRSPIAAPDAAGSADVTPRQP